MSDPVYIRESKTIVVSMIILLIGMIVIMAGIAIGTWQREIIRSEMTEFHTGRNAAIEELKAEILENRIKLQHIEDMLDRDPS